MRTLVSHFLAPFLGCLLFGRGPTSFSIWRRVLLIYSEGDNRLDGLARQGLVEEAAKTWFESELERKRHQPSRRFDLRLVSVRELLGGVRDSKISVLSLAQRLWELQIFCPMLLPLFLVEEVARTVPDQALWFPVLRYDFEDAGPKTLSLILLRRNEEGTVTLETRHFSEPLSSFHLFDGSEKLVLIS